MIVSTSTAESALPSQTFSRRRICQTMAGGAAATLVGFNDGAIAHATAQSDATPAPLPSPEPMQLTDEQREWLDQASKTLVNGWLHVRIQGAPLARGFQYGYLTAQEYKAIRVYTAITYRTTGMDYSFFVDKAAGYH